jgi:hypothetical protein
MKLVAIALGCGLVASAVLAPAARGSSGGVSPPGPVRTPEMPPEATRLHATHYGAVQPSVRFWIGVEAKKAAQAPPGAVTEASLAAATRARFAGQGMGPGDVDTLVALVLVEAAKQAERNLRALADKQRAALEARKKIRALQEALDRQVADASGKPDRAPCGPPACGGLGLEAVAAAVRQTSARVTLPATEPATVGDLRKVADEMKRKADSLSEVGETESLRLQTAMDRLSKLMATLSNLVKQVSETSASILRKLE